MIVQEKQSAEARFEEINVQKLAVESQLKETTNALEKVFLFLKHLLYFTFFFMFIDVPKF